jgi:sterol desaturase/sphingolipid hydroxylase (fatty acid hydroxylase superfamily)
MPQLLTQIVWLSVWLAGLVVIFVPLERLFAVRPHQFLRKEILNDVGYYFLNSLLLALLLSGPVGLVAWALHRVMPSVVQETAASWPLWGRVLAGFVASEVGYYWGHRLSHVIPLLWRFHSLHHSAEQMDFLVSSRAHTRTGPINRNYASTLPWLDWLFGSLYLPRNEWPADYGIKSRLPEAFVEQLAYPLFPVPPDLGPTQPAAPAPQALAAPTAAAEPVSTSSAQG